MNTKQTILVLFLGISVSCGYANKANLENDQDSEAFTGEICNNGLDDNNNQRVDEGCVCVSGERQRCFVGNPSMAGVGLCHWGTQVCIPTSNEFGYWGSCSGYGTASVCLRGGDGSEGMRNGDDSGTSRPDSRNGDDSTTNPRRDGTGARDDTWVYQPFDGGTTWPVPGLDVPTTNPRRDAGTGDDTGIDSTVLGDTGTRDDTGFLFDARRDSGGIPQYDGSAGRDSWSGCVCIPGRIRWCDTPSACAWGRQQCLPDGRWGVCVETLLRPVGCPLRRAYETACCVAARECCQDYPRSYESVGNCAGILECR